MWRLLPRCLWGSRRARRGWVNSCRRGPMSRSEFSCHFLRRSTNHSTDPSSSSTTPYYPSSPSAPQTMYLRRRALRFSGILFRRVERRKAIMRHRRGVGIMNMSAARKLLPMMSRSLSSAKILTKRSAKKAVEIAMGTKIKNIVNKLKRIVTSISSRSELEILSRHIRLRTRTSRIRQPINHRALRGTATPSPKVTTRLRILLCKRGKESLPKTPVTAFCKVITSRQGNCKNPLSRFRYFVNRGQIIIKA